MSGPADWVAATRAYERGRVVVGYRRGSPVMDVDDETGNGTVDFVSGESLMVVRVCPRRVVDEVAKTTLGRAFMEGLLGGEDEVRYRDGRAERASASARAPEVRRSLRDPLWYLECLRGFGMREGPAPGGMVRDTHTTRYTGDVTLARASAQCEFELQIPQRRRWWSKTRSVPVAPAEVWIDEGLRIRRVSVAAVLADKPWPPVWWIAEFFDFQATDEAT